MKSAGFKELTQAVDSCSKDDFSAIATAMMRADHAGGLAFIAGKPITTFGDYAAVRGNPVLDDILKKAITLDFSGRYKPEWDTIATGAMKKFVMGDWSAETIFALHFSKYIAMRDGKRIITEHKDEFASGRWWINANLLEVAKTPLHTAMALIGYGGSAKTDSSFAQFYDGMIERAKRLRNLENDLAQRSMLEMELLNIARSAMKEAATAHAQMLTMPQHLMMRPRTFINENGACAALAGSFDKRILRVEEDKEMKFGAYEKAPVLAPVRAPVQAPVQAAPRHAQAKRGRDEPWQGNSSDPWGDCTQRHGIWLTHTGAICFGNRCMVEMAGGSNLPKVTCYASLYGNSDSLIVNRRRWCSG